MSAIMGGTGGEAGVLMGAIVQVGGRAVSQLIQLVAISLFARSLTQSDFGAWAAALALLAIALPLSDFGITTTVTRDLATVSDGTVLREQISEAYSVLCASCIIVTSASILFGEFLLGGEARSLYPWLAASIVLSRAAELGMGIARAQRRWGLSVAIEVSSRLAMLAAAVASYTTGGSRLELAVTGTLGAGLAGAVVALLAWRPWSALSFQAVRRRTVPLLRRAAPIGALAALGIIHVRQDQLMLGTLVGTEEVARYAVSYRLIEAAIASMTIGLTSFYVAAVRAPEKQAAMLRRTLVILGAAGTLLAALVGIFASSVLQLIGGDVYAGDTAVIRLLAPLVVISLLNSAAAYVVLAEAKAGRLIPIALVGVLGNAVLNLLAIPRLGAEGAAMTTLATETLGLVLVVRMAFELSHRRTQPRLEEAKP